MQVAINDGMPTSNGPSAWKDPPYIPEEYDTSLSKDIRDACDAITTWWDEYGEIIDTGFVWIHSTVSLVFTVAAYTIPTFAVPKTVIVVMDVVAGAFWVRDTGEYFNMIIEKVVS